MLRSNEANSVTGHSNKRTTDVLLPLKAKLNDEERTPTANFDNTNQLLHPANLLKNSKNSRKLKMEQVMPKTLKEK